MPDRVESSQTADIVAKNSVFKVWTSPRGIKRIALPRLDRDLMQREDLRFDVNIKGSTDTAELRWIDLLVDFMSALLNGREPAGAPPADLEYFNGFSRDVLESTGRIPWGETRCYSRLAEEAGCPGGARAVGGALGRNTVPLLVSCHRVIRKDGSTGGFAAGSEWKSWLLELERR